MSVTAVQRTDVAPRSIDPRARDVVSHERDGTNFQLALSCGHIVSRRIMVGAVPARAICHACPAAGGVAMAITVAPPAPRAMVDRPRKRHPSWFDWSDEAHERLKALWADETITIDDIMAKMGLRTRNQVVGRAHYLGLPKRKTGRKLVPGEKRSTKPHDGMQRRFFGVSTHRGARPLGSRTKWAVEGLSRYQNRVTDASATKNVLIGGENNRKIGRMVKKGRWNGFPIFTLTLQERATCPRSCSSWLSCYGNNMNWAIRVQHDGDFLIHLTSELLRLNARFPDGFVVRLHILGDFFDVDYVRFWKMALETTPALHVFGFTARPLESDVGAELQALAWEHWDRFSMRWSDRGWDYAASEVVDRPEDASGVRCPAETDEKRSCGTCGLCWALKKGSRLAPAVPLISFVRH